MLTTDASSTFTAVTPGEYRTRGTSRTSRSHIPMQYDTSTLRQPRYDENYPILAAALTPGYPAYGVLPASPYVPTPRFVPVIPAATPAVSTATPARHYQHPYPAYYHPTPQQYYPSPSTYHPTAGQLMQLTNGLPFPGSEPYLSYHDQPWPPNRQITPVHLAPWMIPNPNDPDTPIIQWDIRRDPCHARRITGRHVSVPLLDDSRSWSKNVVWPPDVTKHVDIDVNLERAHDHQAQIPVNRDGGVRTSDVLYALYDYFQQRMTEAELTQYRANNANAFDRLCEAKRKRLEIEDGLLAYNAAQGFKRVDMLGEVTRWFGTWIGAGRNDNNWSLQLGLIAR